MYAHTHTHTPPQHTLQRASRDELHEDVDGGGVHAGSEVAHDVLVPQASQNPHLLLYLLKLLQRETNIILLLCVLIAQHGLKMHQVDERCASAACARRTGRQQVDVGPEVEGWSEVSTTFLYIRPLVQSTSGNASKTVLSSKSDITGAHGRVMLINYESKV